ncbi:MULTISPECIES: hypothetical protein [unclassified Neptuniibacter]|uniref:hypothetical protein n=1 Tax=unclassified Neptuniibacter TaxID=2630693 RepID=UPI0025E48D55|nr:MULTISPECIES: hypothetical protein [unclassified Neptuniibacter]
MKLLKLLEITEKYLDDDKLRKGERKECLKDIQQKLKKKQKKLKEKILVADGEELKSLQKNLEIVMTQRKKVIGALKELK